MKALKVLCRWTLVFLTRYFFVSYGCILFQNVAIFLGTLQSIIGMNICSFRTRIQQIVSKLYPSFIKGLKHGNRNVYLSTYIATYSRGIWASVHQVQKIYPSLKVMVCCLTNNLSFDWQRFIDQQMSISVKFWKIPWGRQREKNLFGVNFYAMKSQENFHGGDFFQWKRKVQNKRNNKLIILNSFLIFFCDLLNDLSFRKVLLAANTEVESFLQFR